MKRIMRKTIKWFAGIIVVGLLIFLWVNHIMKEYNAEEWALINLTSAGREFFATILWQSEGSLTFPRDGGQAELTAWVRGVSEEGVVIPRNDGMTEAEHQLAFLQEQWRLVQQSDSIHEHTRKYCDASIWTVVKNLPENPPENLVVLATRNIDPSSLRTRFADGDMHKHIRFDRQFEPPPDIPILKKYAVLVYAQGGYTIIPVVDSTSRRSRKETTYDSIYKSRLFYDVKEAAFDLTTNLVGGLQVKYLTPEGEEVIPAND